MKYLVTGKEMQLLDRNTSEHFMMPAVVLMEQAAMGFVRELFFCEENLKDKRVLVVSGTGNNGADGIAVARLLNQQQVRADLYLIGSEYFPEKKGSQLYDLQKQIYEKYQYTQVHSLEDGYDIVIDSLFGIGLSREIRGPFGEVIDRLNRMQGRKIALDIASGVDADCGQLLGSVFRADDTFTFSFGKLGQYLWPGCDYSGRVHVIPMGITEDSGLECRPHCRILESSDLKDLLPQRPAHSNKGTFGKLLIIAGKKNMAGASCLSAKAAYRCGAGLVQVLTCEENRSILQTLVPEAILTTYEGECPENLLQEKMSWAGAIVLGPGMGTGEEARKIVVWVMQHTDKPLLADADALNLIAEELTLLDSCRAPLIITPHLGEMSRLTGKTIRQLQEDLPGEACRFAADHHLYCILKDFRTVIACPDGSWYLNLTGNNGMATGGSGDVLTGIIGGMIAQGLLGEHLWKAAVLGPHLHGMAGDLAAEEKGTCGLIASDLAENLCRVWKKVSQES